MKSNYNDKIYKMYEGECNKNRALSKEIKSLKLERSNLQYELKYQKASFENKMKAEIKK